MKEQEEEAKEEEEVKKEKEDGVEEGGEKRRAGKMRRFGRGGCVCLYTSLLRQPQMGEGVGGKGEGRRGGGTVETAE